MANLDLDIPTDTGSRGRKPNGDIEELVERYFTEFELPSPETLAQYERIFPGAAQKIIEIRVLHEQHVKELVEQTGAHRRLMVLMAYFAIIFVGIIASLFSVVLRNSDWVHLALSIVPAIVGVLAAVVFRANRTADG